MNEPDFDARLRDALAREAEREIAHQQPRRLAMRRLAVRLRSDSGRPEVRARFLDATGPRTRTSPLMRLAGSLGALAAVVVVTAVVVGIVLAPEGRFGSSSPVHESDRHGYTLRLPDDSWFVKEIPGAWRVGEFLDAEGPGGDYFESRVVPSRDPVVYVWLNSQPIRNGMTFDGWLYLQDGVTAAAQPCFQLQGEYEEVRIHGEPGRLGAYRCASFNDSGVPWSTIQVLFQHNGFGYAMYFWPEQEPAAPSFADIRQDALRWLNHFRFREVTPDE